jgi:hypothetical protein
MNPSYFTSPERLEERIAPAGLVTVSFLNGLLTINGADGADHDVDIVKTGAKTFRVEGNATDIDVLGQTAKSFRGALNRVRIEGGTGADTFKLTNLSPLRSFGFNGNAGVDSLSTTKFKTKIGGLVDIALGSETGSVDFVGSRTTIHGSLNIDLGGGGTASFGSAITKIDGDVAITGGPGSDSLSITGDATLFKRKLTFNAGDGDDSFSATGISLNVRGFVTMDGGAGTDLFVFGAGNNKFGNSLTAGLVDLKLGVGTGTVTFLGNSTQVLGDLKIDLGTGGGMAHLNSSVTSIRNNVQVTGGVGNDTLEFEGRTSIGRSLSFLGDTGDDALTATGSLFAVQGATSMDGGSGASTFNLDVVSLALAGLTVTGGTSNDAVSIIADGTIAGDVNLQLGLDGTGPSSTILQSRAGIANGLEFGGTLTIDMVGATVDVLTIANIQVTKSFVAQTGENVSTVDISKLNAKSNFKLQTGAGADVVNIDNVNARDFYVDTQVGADELRIERNASYTGTSRVLGIATILTGIGADQIRIGNSSDPANLKVSFMGAMTLDAGDGANMRNDVLGSNFFVSAPTIVATGGTLTQTEAV